MKFLRYSLSYLILLLLSHNPIFAQTQIGANIVGEGYGMDFGDDVSISASGDRVAVSSYLYNSGRGIVRVFEWTGSSWGQVGDDLKGDEDYDTFGRSISLSGDGRRLVVGADGNDANGTHAGQVRVFEWSGNNWQQLGSNLNGEREDDAFGEAVHISTNGARVAIGAYSNDGNGTDSGHTRIYEWNGTEWMKMGEDIDGEGFDQFSGESVVLSSDGSRVAIGAVLGQDDFGEYTGNVRIFEWTGSEWGQLGKSIGGVAKSDYAGWEVSLNGEGNVVAFGAYGNDENGERSGQARVFKWNGNEWMQLGTDLKGEAPFDYFGIGVSLSSNGKRLAVSADSNDGNGDGSGQVRIFGWNGIAWSPVLDIYGESSGEYLGTSIEFSEDGERLIAGAPAARENGVTHGLARVYEIPLMLPVPESTFDLYPNPSNGIIELQGIEYDQIVISNGNGSVIQVETELISSLDVSSLPTGIYFIQFSIGDQKIVKKIYKQ